MIVHVDCHCKQSLIFQTIRPLRVYNRCYLSAHRVINVNISIVNHWRALYFIQGECAQLMARVLITSPFLEGIFIPPHVVTASEEILSLLDGSVNSLKFTDKLKTFCKLSHSYKHPTTKLKKKNKS